MSEMFVNLDPETKRLYKKFIDEMLARADLFTEQETGKPAPVNTHANSVDSQPAPTTLVSALVGICMKDPANKAPIPWPTDSAGLISLIDRTVRYISARDQLDYGGALIALAKAVPMVIPFISGG